MSCGQGGAKPLASESRLLQARFAIAAMRAQVHVQARTGGADGGSCGGGGMHGCKARKRSVWGSVAGHVCAAAGLGAALAQVVVPQCEAAACNLRTRCRLTNLNTPSESILRGDSSFGIRSRSFGRAVSAFSIRCNQPSSAAPAVRYTILTVRSKCTRVSGSRGLGTRIPRPCSRSCPPPQSPPGLPLLPGCSPVACQQSLPTCLCAEQGAACADQVPCVHASQDQLQAVLLVHLHAAVPPSSATHRPRRVPPSCPCLCRLCRVRAWRVLHDSCMPCAWRVRGVCVLCAWRVRGVCAACACRARGVCVPCAWLVCRPCTLCGAVRCSAVRRGAVRCGAVRCDA